MELADLPNKAVTVGGRAKRVEHLQRHDEGGLLLGVGVEQVPVAVPAQGVRLQGQVQVAVPGRPELLLAHIRHQRPAVALTLRTPAGVPCSLGRHGLSTSLHLQAALQACSQKAGQQPPDDLEVCPAGALEFQHIVAKVPGP